MSIPRSLLLPFSLLSLAVCFFLGVMQGYSSRDNALQDALMLLSKKSLLSIGEEPMTRSGLNKALALQMLDLMKATDHPTDDLQVFQATKVHEALGRKSKCWDREDEESCLLDSGYQKGANYGECFNFEKLDLNEDGQPDYIVTTNNKCGRDALLNVYTREFFVLLSGAAGKYHLGYETNASFLSVVKDSAGQLVLVDGISSYNAVSQEISRLDKDKRAFRRSVCIYRDNVKFPDATDPLVGAAIVKCSAS